MQTLKPQTISRRKLLAAGSATIVSSCAVSAAEGDEKKASKIVRPPEGKGILLSVKLGMITKKAAGKTLTLTERLQMAGEAGLDGVDFDEAGAHTEEAARKAVDESGVFVHNAINHAHWGKRLTSPNEADRDISRKNIEHCIRLSHAAGGNGVLIVVGGGGDGPAEVIEERCRNEIKKIIPLAASLGQPILFENVWNQMFYDHNEPPEQSAERHVKFIDSFKSVWVGQYYDIGNHWKYGQPGEWIREFGHRCVKLDVKGFSREKNKFTEIGEGDLPWNEVRKGLSDIGFTGWATAEVGGGGLDRLKKVREQMQRAFGL
ncbi:MAG: sugar phosphate isomerase/epimerase family protein [Verrucomicrobiota bacterium]|nr:sugar phosphate isomerase/epimerase family protein [Verrucomicrobiota bacterium]